MIRWTRTLGHNRARPPAHAALHVASIVLRGVGQGALQANSVAGLVFVLAVAWSSPPQALALVWGASLSTALAALLRVDLGALCNGLWGFNGALAALTTVLFAPPVPSLWLAATVAALGTVPITLALQKWLARWRLPTLSLPFILALWCVLLAARLLSAAPPPAAPATPLLGAPIALNVEQVAYTLLNGIAQVFFQAHAGTGALVLLGLFISAPRAALLAALGTACASAMAWVLGTPAEALQSGVHGFSGALAAVAVGMALLPATAQHLRTTLWAMVAASLTPLIGSVFGWVLAPVGLPVLTLPFVVASWGVLGLHGISRKTHP